MSIGTEYTQLEPRGWSHSEWGQPSTEDKEFRTDGWGENVTVFTEYTDD